MKGFNTDQLIASLTEITQNNIDFVSKKCVHLGENQLEWRPKQGSWNILEILSHLNSYSSYYHKNFKERIAKTKFKSVKENFVSSPLGKSAWKSMKLGRANNVKRKFKAPKNYNPLNNTSIVSHDAVNKFINDQKELIEILELTKSVNLKKVKIKISISKIVRLRLGDALMFVIYHNERHIQQIKNLMSHPNFPKKQ
tara:strand:+ start:96218 stop:96808 length:591 start_codon:yes stop_codon:yes gene_type:complete